MADEASSLLDSSFQASRLGSPSAVPWTAREPPPTAQAQLDMTMRVVRGLRITPLAQLRADELSRPREPSALAHVEARSRRACDRRPGGLGQRRAPLPPAKPLAHPGGRTNDVLVWRRRRECTCSPGSCCRWRPSSGHPLPPVEARARRRGYAVAVSSPEIAGPNCRTTSIGDVPHSAAIVSNAH